MEKKRVMFWSVAIATVAIVFTSCDLDMPKEVHTSFETMTVKKSDIELPYKFSAKMKGQNDVTITPQVSGQLMQICVAEGQQVKKGAPLFIIDSRNAQLELEAAQANLQAALAQENSAKLEFESNKNLFDKKIVSSYLLNNSENQYKQAQAAVAQAQAAVNRAKVNLGFCTITAPVSVTEAIVESMVQSGMKAADVDKYIASLPAATFVMKNGTEYPHKGRVISLTGVVNAATGSLTSKVSFPNPEGHLYSGIQGTIVMPFAEKSVIVIPQHAVVRLQDKSLVYKVKADSTATVVNVTTEDTGNGKDFIVTSGLKEGDQIVTIGANNVTEGQKVLFPAEVKSEK